jgi:hypothetical protein
MMKSGGQEKMKIVFRILTVVLFCLPIACAKTERNKEKTPSGTPISSAMKSRTPAVSVEKSRRTIFAYNYSEAGIWEKGINIKAGNQFFINIEKSKPTPISTGERLEFKTAGVAIIIAISRMEFNGYSSIYVIVDKPLSPDGDGYPNPIFISEDRG